MLSAGLYHLQDSGASCAGRPVYRFAPANRWLFSHQPGIWRRELLLEGRSGGGGGVGGGRGGEACGVIGGMCSLCGFSACFF